MTRKLTEKLQKMTLDEGFKEDVIRSPRKSKLTNYDHKGDPCEFCGLEGDGTTSTE